MKSNNVRAVKLFIERKRQDNKRSVTTRDCGSGFSEYWNAGIFFRLRKFMKKKKTKENGTPFRPVKILRWPRCFVYWSLFTRKSFTVLSHFAACRSGTTYVSLESAGHRAAFTNPTQFFLLLKKVLQLRWAKFSYRHSTAREAHLYRRIIQNYFYSTSVRSS